MLNGESLQVAEEEVVESSSNKLCDIYTFVAKGSFPQTMNSLRKKNLKRYAQKFIFDGKPHFIKLILIDGMRHFGTDTCKLFKPFNLTSPDLEPLEVKWSLTSFIFHLC